MLRRRRPSFWLVLAGTTVFLTINPALFLVVLALALSGVALVWAVMLVRGLIVEAFVAEDSDDSLPAVCPLRAWRGDGVDLSSSAQRAPSDPGAFS
jgi:hypothetical protein